MLATMQRMLHKLTRSRRAPAKAKVIAKLVGMRWRYVWAQPVLPIRDLYRELRNRSSLCFRAGLGTPPKRFPPPLALLAGSAVSQMLM